MLLSCSGRCCGKRVTRQLNMNRPKHSRRSTALYSYRRRTATESIFFHFSTTFLHLKLCKECRVHFAQCTLNVHCFSCVNWLMLLKYLNYCRILIHAEPIWNFTNQCSSESSLTNQYVRVQV